MSRFRLLLLATCLTLAACQTAQPPVPQPPEISEPPGSINPAPAGTPAAFADLPGWPGATLIAAMGAFQRSCGRLVSRPAGAALSTRATWAGTVDDWRSACAALEVASDEASARTVFEALFTPVEIIDPAGSPKFTGYFEPTYAARRAPSGMFTEPVMALPADFVANGDAPLQRFPDGTTRPYPTRAEITASGGPAIAYAHPADVFFLQVQGSGRLTFEDGSTIRAAYAAHNGQPFKSVANWLISTGRITRAEGSMQGIRAWMDRASPADVREAMNINPRFVFFRPLPEGDPALGPEGAQSVPLTPLGSMAIDPDFHPLGIPMFVETSAPGLGGNWSGLLIAQDTGGAIKGPVRGDLYFGTGNEAGNRAGTMNAPGRLWVLLPRRVAAQAFAPRPVALAPAPGRQG